MVFQVRTTWRVRDRDLGRVRLRFFSSEHAGQAPVEAVTVEAGIMRVAARETTLVDLVTHVNASGGPIISLRFAEKLDRSRGPSWLNGLRSLAAPSFAALVGLPTISERWTTCNRCIWLRSSMRENLLSCTLRPGGMDARTGSGQHKALGSLHARLMTYASKVLTARRCRIG